MKKENKPAKPHNLNLADRENLNMDGVEEVISFNDNKIILKTHLGGLEIKGKDLNVEKLNLEDNNIIIKGYVNSLIYSDRAPDENLIKRIFK